MIQSERQDFSKFRDISSVSPPVNTELTPAWCYMERWGGRPLFSQVATGHTATLPAPVRMFPTLWIGYTLCDVYVINLELLWLHKNNKLKGINEAVGKYHIRTYAEDTVLIVVAVPETELWSMVYGNIDILR